MSGYRYTESGLDNIIVEGVHVADGDDGDHFIMIPNVNGLHKAIAAAIVNRHASMSGRELRFLRTELGMTHAELAAMLHQTVQEVNRWEGCESPIDANAEAVIRLYAIQVLQLADAPNVKDVAGWCVPSAHTPPIVVDGSDPSNYHVKIAA
jgi:DNA-binding transcriptional regulator YiaG